ncbi:MAG: hypothetical protein JKP98_06050 [Rhodobacteraceae bacterium]|nr:hypothetical protein [Paracoccaceae bacterium]
MQIREAQLRRQRALEDWAAAEERRFLRAAQPVLRSLMAEAGASVLLDERSVLLALPELDLTDPAIARIDAVLGDGADDAAALPEMISLIDAAAGVARFPASMGRTGRWTQVTCRAGRHPSARTSRVWCNPDGTAPCV